MSSEISEFYDNYSKSQQKIGVNIRHYTILQKLKKAGLKKDSDVLEIGCGIGTLTGLIAKFISAGTLTATDISPESIDVAKKRTNEFRNITYFVTDMTDFIPEKKFDFIVFPDVLEHIPKEQHNAIFKNLANAVNRNTKIAIHIPDPLNLEYVQKHNPELLQIIDQPLFLQDFAQAIKGTNFIIDFYERYTLFNTKPDYNWLIFSVKYDYPSAEKRSKYILKLKELQRRFLK